VSSTTRSPAISPPFARYGRIDLRGAFIGRHIRISLGKPPAQRIEPLAHSSNPGKQLRVHESGHRLAVLVDHDAVIPVLHMVQHFAQILAKVDGADFGYHRNPQIITTNMVIMIHAVPLVQP
jgi:hypothetical protein